jgi:bacterioferritin-associated ferredoxin
MARTTNGATFAFLVLACSECHELFNHEASQSNCGACLSAAGDKAEFLYSAFADVKMLQFTSS